MKFLNCLFLIICLLSIVSQTYSANLKPQGPRRYYYVQSGMKTNETGPRRYYYIQKESTEKPRPRKYYYIQKESTEKPRRIINYI